MTIDNLNVYQLIEIFEYLTLDERSVCSKVCRKWKSAIDYLGIQQLTVFYFTQHNMNQINSTEFNSEQSIDHHFSNRLNRSNHNSNRIDRRFITYIQTDKLLSIGLGNSLFRKLRNLTIFANSSLQLADSYLNLKQLSSLESLQIDNRSLCLCLGMSLERDRIRLDNLKYINLHRINLKTVVRSFPNLIEIKCIQIDCDDRFGFYEKFNEFDVQKQIENLYDKLEDVKNEKLDKKNEKLDVKNEKIGNQNNQMINSNQSNRIKWRHFELNDLIEVNDYFYEFLIENCFLIEHLKINIRELDDVILLIKTFKHLKRLKFNCKTNESILFRQKLEDLIRLVKDLNLKGQHLRVEFNGLELANYSNELSSRYEFYSSNHELDKFLLIKSGFHTLNYFDLIKIDQSYRNRELQISDLESLFTCWCLTIHINQNLDNLNILSFSGLNFVAVKQLFFKPFDYDEKKNDEQLKFLLKKLPNLRSIDLTSVHRLDQVTLDHLPIGCPKLNELSLSSNSKRTICLKFISNLSELEGVEFYKCKFVNSTDLNELTSDLKYLTQLSLNDCDNLVNVDQLFIAMYRKATMNRRLEYNLYLDKPYSLIINQQFSSSKYPQIRNFFFMD